MKKKTVFGKWETVCILLNVICTKIFLNYPRLASEQGGTAAWLFSVYVSLLALGAFALISRLYKPFGGKDLLEVSECVGGGFGRIATAIVIIMFLGWTTTVYLRTFSENMKLVSLTVSPLSFVEVFFLACMIAGAYFGIEAISRFHAIAVPFVVIGFFLLMIGVSSYIDLNNLFPILGAGLDKIVIQGFPKVSVFSEILLLFILAPFLKTHENMKSSGLWAIALSSVSFIVSSFVYLTVFAYPTTLEKVIPIFHIARLINLGRFFQRVEAIFMVIWALASLLYVTVNFYIILYVIQKAFRLEHYKPLIVPVALILFCLSFFPPNLVEAVRLEVDVFRTWSWIPAFVLPIALLTLAGLKKKKSG